MHKPNAAHKATPISPRSSPHPRPVRDQRVAATVTGESPVVPPPNTGMGSGSSGLQSWSHHNIRAALLTFLVLLTHRPTYAYGPSIRVHTSLVCGQAQQAPPVVLDLGFLRALHSHKNDSHHHHHSSSSSRFNGMEVASNSSTSNSSNPRPPRSMTDEDERNRDRTFSIVPSSFRPSSLASKVQPLTFAADVQNSTHHFPPAWASWRACSPISCLRLVPAGVLAWKNGPRSSRRRGTHSRSRCTSRPTYHMRISRSGWWRPAVQLAPQQYPYDHPVGADHRKGQGEDAR
jgi:hypothetical protein